ncbi:hypothetical protein [Bradyrhizobium sp. CCBAU 051011]|jgi:hypothetical protein|uniref:hypothetical protein n=1 Tax=Bradyrhizobium sp. CCBAU 051011 TaxID=858422 RepID=UPI0013795C2E|nr:hypothetical protein [Bradyrhizobium sp. CCBAU 051011]
MAALLFWEAHSACKPARAQITCLGDVSRGHSATPKNEAQKKQGRRRSIPSTTLPAPDIEIGSRHPVNFRMPAIHPAMCEPVHKVEKSCGNACRNLWKISRRKAGAISRPTSVMKIGRLP